MITSSNKYTDGNLGPKIGFFYPVSTTMDFQFMKKSKVLICPAIPGKVDTLTHAAFIEILGFSSNQSYEGFFPQSKRAMGCHCGVPHWCKQCVQCLCNSRNV